MKRSELELMMRFAEETAKLSKARRAKVGAILLDDKYNIVCYGYNGTHKGADNNCEDELEDGSLVTKDEVIHAEENLIIHAARRGISVDGGTIISTMSPCKRCTSRSINLGIKEIIYLERYRLHDEVEAACGKYIKLTQI